MLVSVRVLDAQDDRLTDAVSVGIVESVLEMFNEEELVSDKEKVLVELKLSDAVGDVVVEEEFVADRLLDALNDSLRVPLTLRVTVGVAERLDGVRPKVRVALLTEDTEEVREAVLVGVSEAVNLGVPALLVSLKVS